MNKIVPANSNPLFAVTNLYGIITINGNEIPVLCFGEVLVHLDVQSLCKLKRVCKVFYDLFSDAVFLRQMMERSMNIFIAANRGPQVDIDLQKRAFEVSKVAIPNENRMGWRPVLMKIPQFNENQEFVRHIMLTSSPTERVLAWSYMPEKYDEVFSKDKQVAVVMLQQKLWKIDKISEELRSDEEIVRASQEESCCCFTSIFACLKAICWRS
jgi:hypothetical protein